MGGWPCADCYGSTLACICTNTWKDDQSPILTQSFNDVKQSSEPVVHKEQQMSNYFVKHPKSLEEVMLDIEYTDATLRRPYSYYEEPEIMNPRHTRHYAWTHNQKVYIETEDDFHKYLDHIKVITYKGAKFDLLRMFREGWSIRILTNVYSDRVRIQCRETELPDHNGKYSSMLVQTELSKDEFDYCDNHVEATFVGSERNQRIKPNQMHLEQELEVNDIPWLLDVIGKLQDIKIKAMGKPKKKKIAKKKAVKRTSNVVYLNPELEALMNQKVADAA